MRDLLLGIDIGTSSSKAVLASPDGVVVASETIHHELSMPHPGWAEHDADRIWWGETVALCRRLGSRCKDVAAVGVSGIGPCVLPLDGSLRPLRPAILYGIDTRSSEEVIELTDRLGDDVLARCGSSLSSQAAGPKLLWLSRHEPSVWKATRRFAMASSFIVGRLTGEYVLDHHSASQCAPLYDIWTREWANDWVDEILPDLELPRLLWPADVAGLVTVEASAATGLRAGTPVAAGTIDAWAEALSVNVCAAGDTMLQYGTTMFVVHVVGRPSPRPQYWTTAGVAPGSYSVAAGMATSGALTAWFRQLLADATFQGLLEEAREAGAGASGLLALPYFAGERSPFSDPHARGAIIGLTLSHTRGDIYRALLEATAFGARHIFEAMAETASIEGVTAVGGGTQGGLWTQIVSDVTQLEQAVPRETIGASYGDARLAGLAVGRIDWGDPWNAAATSVEPNPHLASIYDGLYETYRRLYPQLRDTMHHLARIQLDGAGDIGQSGWARTR
jgi:xylulokinase